MFPFLSTFQLSSVSKGTKKNTLIRILNFGGYLLVSPLDILDVFECQFRFFILRMRLNDSKGILWAQFGSHDFCYPEASRKRVQSGLCARCFVDMCCQEREFFVLFCFDKA